MVKIFEREKLRAYIKNLNCEISTIELVLSVVEEGFKDENGCTDFDYLMTNINNSARYAKQQIDNIILNTRDFLHPDSKDKESKKFNAEGAPCARYEIENL